MALDIVISDALIIKACNTPTGSGGVARWANKVAREIEAEALMYAPTGNPLNKGSHPVKFGGTYRASFFVETGRRGNQHQVIRYIGNSAPHAAVVEGGRVASYERQVFTWAARGGKWQRFTLTAGREGSHYVEWAFRRVCARYGLL